MPSSRNQKHILQQDVDDHFNGVKTFKKFKSFVKHEDKSIWQYQKKVVCVNKIQETLLKLYKDPLTGFCGRDSLYNKVKLLYLGITRSDVIDFLRANNVSQIHQLHTKQKTIVPTIVKQPDKYFLVDLVLGYKNISPYNDGKEILLTMVDANSRKLYTRALKNKEQETVGDAIIEILTSLKTTPKILRSDNGSEFVNDYLKTKLEKLGIKQIFSDSYTPQSNGLIERLNGTIKRRIGLYMTQNNTKRWVDVLQDLTENYNNTVHSSTGQTPNDMANDGVAQQLGNDKIEKESLAMFNNQKRNHPDIKVNDYVRLSLLYDSNERKLKLEGRRKDSSVQNWSNTIYRVLKVNKGRSLNPLAPLKQRLYKDAKYNIREVGKYGESDILKNIRREYLLLTVSPDKIINKPKKDEVLKPIEIYSEDDEKLKLQKEALNEQMVDEPIADRVKSRRYQHDDDDDDDDTDDKEVKEVKEPEPVGNVFEVEKILDHRQNTNGSKSYFTKWKGLNETNNTWEKPDAFLGNDKEKLTAYLKKVEADSKLVDTSDVFEVEKILDHKKHNSKFNQYLVKWIGYDDTTWQWNSDFIGKEARAILTAYRKAHKIKATIK